MKVDETTTVDAVITWVDSGDKNWQFKIDGYLENKIDWNNKKDSTRYNSVNEIEVSITSILKNATFIKNIYLVTDQQQPVNFSKLKDLAATFNVNLLLVDHQTIFEGYTQYLPTFNSQSIETMLYRIPNLSEHFVYFNDDLFLINNTKVTDFFIDGKPVLRGNWIKYNEDVLIKRIFHSKKKKNKISHRKAKEKGSKLSGFKKIYSFYHTPHPMRKSTFENYFKLNEDVLISNIKHRFRHVDQFVPQSLVNHIEIKNNSWVQEPKIALMYFQSYGFLKFTIKFNLLKLRKKHLFMCLQSLELAPKQILNTLLSWVDYKLETNFNDTNK